MCVVAGVLGHAGSDLTSTVEAMAACIGLSDLLRRWAALVILKV